MDENPIERDVKAAEGIFKRDMEVLDKAVGNVAPVGKRRLTEREMVTRWITATPEQRERSRVQWGDAKYQQWNTEMFRAYRRYTG